MSHVLSQEIQQSIWRILFKYFFNVHIQYPEYDDKIQNNAYYYLIFAVQQVP